MGLYVSHCTILPNEDSSKSILVQIVFFKGHVFLLWYFISFFCEVLDNLLRLRLLCILTSSSRTVTGPEAISDA